MMLNNYPDTFIAVEIHTTGQYTTQWGNQRITFYGVSGTPTAWFDGVDPLVGAYTDVNQQYNWYRDEYLARLPVPTDVTVNVQAVKVSPTSCQVFAEIGIEPGGVGKRVRLHMIQVLDHWPTSPSYSRNTVKQGQIWGMFMTLEPGQTGVLSRRLTFDAESWANESNIRVVVWAQSTETSAPAEVYNAGYVSGPFHWLTGDLNCDGEVGFTDINPFVLAIGGEAGYYAVYPECNWYNADINHDGLVSFADINPFVALLVGL
jgi:hypothetical protein